jgi:pimeloyl-ACP methyl ester carboxylesterase
MTDPVVVLVHGAWHGAWSWAALQAELDRRGVPSIAIDLPGHGASTLPLGDLHGDAQHVADVLDVLARPVLLVGHSYGGAVVTEAAVRSDHVRGLVYLAAFALEAGEAVRDLSRAVPRDTLLRGASIPRDDGTSVLDPVACAAGDLRQLSAGGGRRRAPPGRTAAATPRSPRPTTGNPRPGIPSTYVLCLRDEAVHPDVQRHMAARCDRTVELDTDHCPMLSAVPATADVIADDYARLTR